MGRRSRLYAPASLVTAFHTVPRSTSVATTAAPLIGAPLGSNTVPTMLAVTSWLHMNGDAVISNTTARKTDSAMVSDFIIFITDL